ncbi:hypothetical protein C4K04_0188 [Pseudomonas chlororaphis]|uniref:Uncharacterized protein n=1 Tax=Pseudomonas chlororaphis TaxID=587753 RepID=A0A3G7TFM8_9PSED|nr:hypothetical protein C4K04_0188 [Pseudomonas chlororaphis]
MLLALAVIDKGLGRLLGMLADPGEGRPALLGAQAEKSPRWPSMAAGSWM